jgi:uncharacterized protein YoxC
MNLPLWAFVLSQLIWAVVAGWAIYYGAYLKKKGENLATHEDIAKLKEQVQVITTTTKEIETKISDEAWNRQKRWELKREVLFDTVKSLADLWDALIALNASVQGGQQQDSPGWRQSFADRQASWMRAAAQFRKAGELVDVTCSIETAMAVQQFSVVAFQIANRIMKEEAEIFYFNEQQQEAVSKLFAAKAAVRKELGLDSTL